MNSRRLIASSRGSGQGIVAAQTSTVKGPAHVRFGSLADIQACQRDVRFTSESGRHRLQWGLFTTILAFVVCFRVGSHRFL